MMIWHVYDKNEKTPKNRLLLCYCPGWSDTGYQVAEFDGKIFEYEDQPNEGFHSFVEQWSFFTEAN